MKVPILTIRVLRTAALAVSLLACCASLMAQPPAPEKIRPKAYLSDLAGAVDASWKPRIESLCSELDQKTGAQLAVVTIRSLEGEPIEEYANRWLRAWGIGRKENKGALLLLVIQDKRMRLEVGYGLEPVLPDGFAGSVLREMREPLRRASYGEALFRGANTVAARITNQMAAETNPSTPATPQSSGRSSSIPFLPALPVIVIILVIVALRRKLIGRGSGPVIWSSGGFGGYDSGSSYSSSSDSSSSSSDFGGFGGGDSGGGGSSSDW